MRTLVLSSVRHNRARYLATLIAILTGVAFYAATGFVSDRVINSLEGDAVKQYANVDVAVIADPAEEPGGSSAEVDAGEFKLSDRLAQRVLRLDGIEAGAGTLTGKIGFLGADGKPFAEDAVGRLTIDDDDLDPLDYEKGRAPAAAGEIAVDRGLAEEHDLSVGDQETVLTLAGQAKAEIVGITSFGDSDALDASGTVSVAAANAFDWLNAGQREYEEFYLRASDDPDELRTKVDAVLPAPFTAQSGDEFRDDRRESAGSIGRYLKTALQGFSILALLVGAFVIYNTFSVIIAQRLRELALLSAIGATPKQLKRSLRMEGLVIGVIGSALGIVAAIALTFVLIAVLKAFGVELPGSGIAVTSGTVFGAILIGTAITVASVSIPARRAGRTDPIEALRASATESAGSSRKRGITAAVLLALGALGLLAGGSAAVVGLAALAFILGVLVAGPYIALVGARVARPLLSRFGMEGRLAADNSARNPQRTATTANALLIGVFLVTLVTVAGTSVKDFAVGEINKLSSADYLIISDGGSIDSKLVGDLQRIDGVDRVAPFRNEVVTADGRHQRLSTGELAVLRDIADIDVEQGDIGKLGPGTIAIVDDGSKTVPRVGSKVEITDNGGQTVNLKVVAIIKQSIDAALIGSLVERETFDALVGDVAPTAAFLDLQSGAQTSTRDSIEERVELRPDIALQEGNAIGRTIGSIFDFVINAVVGLLLMSVVIALIGIINTLSLSILERRRELGLLRVIGMTDDRVRRMVRLESLLIAGLGTLGGLFAGLFIGISLILSIDRLSDADIAISIPWLELAGVMAAGIVLGVVAALIPARRSTRLEVLDAIGSI